MGSFDTFYVRWYGRRFLIIPAFSLVTVVFILTFFVGETSFVDIAKRNGVTEPPFMTVPDIALASIAGAYAFVAWDIILRVARRTLAPSDILGSIVRMLIAIPLGYSLSALVKDDVGAFIAFAGAAFPIQTIQTILQRLLNKQLQLEVGAGNEKDQVINLSGVDRETADQLADADITTILQVAYCDPVQTCMRTSLNFAVVGDISAQALCWIYFEEDMLKLRKIGLRGACEVRSLVQDLEGTDAGRASSARAVADSAAKCLSVSIDGFEKAAHEIADDPYTVFLANTWTENSVP